MNLGGWGNGKWSWGDFGISWEKQNSIGERFMRLQNMLSDFQLVVGVEDILQWSGVSSDVYIVREGYQISMCSKLQDRLDPDRCCAFSKLWRMQDPTRNKSFGWRIFLIRVATKANWRKEVCDPVILMEFVLCALNLQKIWTIYYSSVGSPWMFKNWWGIGLVVLFLLQTPLGSILFLGVVFLTVQDRRSIRV